MCVYIRWSMHKVGYQSREMNVCNKEIPWEKGVCYNLVKCMLRINGDAIVY